MLFGLADDELGYIVPANDFNHVTFYPTTAGRGRDRCGDDDHYEETNSASSYLAPAIANALASMLDPAFLPTPQPTALGGTTGADGHAEAAPGAGTRGLWVDTSRTGGHEREEDAQVRVALPTHLSGCWGFLNGQMQDTGTDPTGGYSVERARQDFDDRQPRHTNQAVGTASAMTRGFWVDLDGDCAFGTGDGFFFADLWALSEGQPRFTP